MTKHDYFVLAVSEQVGDSDDWRNVILERMPPDTNETLAMEIASAFKLMYPARRVSVERVTIKCVFDRK